MVEEADKHDVCKEEAVYAAVYTAGYFAAAFDCRKARHELDGNRRPFPFARVVHYGGNFLALPVLPQEAARFAQQRRGGL